MKKRLRTIYAHIKDRCMNKKSDCFKNYGGRGIKICDEWKNNFLAFYNWAINNGYQDNLTIDRINNNGNYEPNNCRWTTRAIQNRNHRRNIKITYKNKTMCLTDWAEELNIIPNTLLYRIRRGWTIERAITTPVKSKGEINDRI